MGKWTTYLMRVYLGKLCWLQFNSVQIRHTCICLSFLVTCARPPVTPDRAFNVRQLQNKKKIGSQDSSCLVLVTIPPWTIYSVSVRRLSGSFSLCHSAISLWEKQSFIFKSVKGKCGKTEDKGILLCCYSAKKSFVLFLCDSKDIWH